MNEINFEIEVYGDEHQVNLIVAELRLLEAKYQGMKIKEEK